MLRKSDYCNIPNFIEDKLGRKLHNQKNHPIEIIKNHIYQYFLNNYQFEIFDDLSPIVSVENNFDENSTLFSSETTSLFLISY